MMRVIGVSAVGQVRPEIEQLKGGQQRWQDPEHQKVHHRHTDQVLHNIEGDRHPHNLVPGDIMKHESGVPTPETFVLAIVEVWILVTSRVCVVFFVPRQKLAKGEQCIKPNTERPDPIVEFAIGRKNSSVHRVVGSDKQTGEQHGLQGHAPQQPR